MTCIAWDGKTLAADKRSSFAGLPCTTTKIIRAPNGALVGVAGDTGMCRALRQWYCDGADPEKHPDKDKACDMLVIEPGGRILFYTSGPHPVHIEDKFKAIGSGRDYAMAAMHYGHGAREGVELACMHEINCGNGIDTLTFEA